MEEYNKSSHAIYRCEYHFIWVPKYRYHVLVKEIKPRLKELLVELCNWLDITIIEGAICSDHVHMYLSVPPKYSPAHVMKILKGKSAEYLRRDFPELGKKYWGLHIWARGYFVSTRSNETRAAFVMEGRQRMTLSGVVVLYEGHRQGRW